MEKKRENRFILLKCTNKALHKTIKFHAITQVNERILLSRKPISCIERERETIFYINISFDREKKEVFKKIQGKTNKYYYCVLKIVKQFSSKLLNYSVNSDCH